MNRQILKGIVFTGLFAVPFIPLLVSGSLFFPFITTKAFAFRIIVEIIFAAWVLLALAEPEYRPKKSPILYALLAFLAVIGLADLLGANPVKSFWSNFERMEGYIALLHLGAFFLVIGSVFKEVDWKRWWNTTLGASVLMVIFSLAQIAGLKSINQGGVRVDGTLGNATYLAVYMLFHLFIALLLLYRGRDKKMLVWVYGLMALSHLSIIYFTATRGAILGVIGGLIVAALMNLRNKEDKVIRKASLSLIAGIVVIVAGFFLFKDTNFVQESPVLSRFATLNVSEIKTQGRYFVWPMAIEGVKDRPVLGWGQDNFIYIFSEHYRPEMYRLEPWFDRAHNIFLDWAVAGGVLGLLSYLSLYFVLLYVIWRKDAGLSTGEKSILTGLMAAYFFHNFFVFDNLISYTMFFSVLSYLYARTGTEPVWHKSVSYPRLGYYALPAGVVLVGVLWFANLEPFSTNRRILEGLRSVQENNPGEAAVHFMKGVDGSSLGHDEAVEQMISSSISILGSQLSIEDKNNFFSFAKAAAIENAEADPQDARGQLMTGSFLSSVGSFDESLQYLERARELTPTKQQVYFEIGSAYIANNEPGKALEAFKEAYDLAPRFEEAKIVYLIGAIYAGEPTLESKLIGEISESSYTFDDRIISAYYNNNRMSPIISILENRIELDPKNENIYREYIKQIRNLGN